MPLKRSPMPPRTKPLAKVGTQKPKRQKRYARYLSSPDWKEKKALVRQRSGGRCERVIVWSGVEVRCNNPSHTVNHVSYGVRSLADVPIDKLEDLCKDCNALYTTSHNANWMGRR